MNTTAVNSHSSHHPSQDKLLNLLFIRSLALLGQIGVLGYVLLANRTTEDLWGMTLSLVALAVLTMATFWRCTRPLLAYSLLLYYRPFPLFTPHAQMGHGGSWLKALKPSVSH